MFYCFSKGCPAGLSAYDREITGMGKHSSTEQWTLNGSYNMLSRAYTFQGERNQNENGRNTRGVTTGMEAISVRSGRVSRIIASIITGEGWFFCYLFVCFSLLWYKPPQSISVCVRERESKRQLGVCSIIIHTGEESVCVCVTTYL